MKLVRREPESGALEAALRDWPERTSVEVARVEVLRAARLGAARMLPRARQVLDDIGLLRLTPAVQRLAAELDPPSIRALDAIHVAAARSLEGELGVLITYDKRMLAAAQAVQLPTLAPR